LWVRSLQRLISARDRFTENPYNDVAEPMRHYLAVMSLWAMGVGTILAGHEKFLAKLLLEPAWKPVYGNPEPQPAVRCLNPSRRVIADDRAPGGAVWTYPQSHHIRAASRDALRELEPDDAAYQSACDRLECLASLVSMDWRDFRRQPWRGEWLLEERRSVAARVAQELAPGWPLLEGGAFGGDLARAEAARDELQAWMRDQPM